MQFRASGGSAQFWVPHTPNLRVGILVMFAKIPNALDEN